MLHFLRYDSPPRWAVILDIKMPEHSVYHTARVVAQIDIVMKLRQVEAQSDGASPTSQLLKPAGDSVCLFPLACS